MHPQANGSSRSPSKHVALTLLPFLELLKEGMDKVIRKPSWCWQTMLSKEFNLATEANLQLSCLNVEPVVNCKFTTLQKIARKVTPLHLLSHHSVFLVRQLFIIEADKIGGPSMISSVPDQSLI